MTDHWNFVNRVRDVARSDPSRRALIFPTSKPGKSPVDYGTVTFKELNEESDRYAQGLRAFGIGRGTRVLLLVPVSVELLTLALALLKMGAILVLIDPGMGKKSLLKCVQHVQPRGLIAVPLVHALRTLSRKSFGGITHAVTVGAKWWWGGPTHWDLRNPVWTEFPVAAVSREELAAIVFTTGSTGLPKGVHYTHGVFDAQVKILEREFHAADRVGLAAFPTMALYYLAMGIPCVLPPVDPARVARVNPADIVDAVDRFGVTSAAGSPMFWDPVVRHCRAAGRRLDTLKTVTMFGAPVRGSLLEEFAAVLPSGGRTFTPYGATEALPVSSLSGDEILADTWPQTRAGAGVCVGRPFAELTVKILPISDEPIPDWDDARVLPAGTIGEIVVKGPVVTKRYDHHDRENIWAKIYEGSDVWHRMGDAGYFDDRGRLWFCGRKNHRVETAGGVLYSVPVEEIFNAHPRVFRAALVGLGSRPRQHPVLIVEPRPGAAPRGRAERAAFIDELKALAKNHSSLGEIRDILFHPGLPVDYRHNAKIIREELVPWAAKELGGR